MHSLDFDKNRSSQSSVFATVDQAHTRTHMRASSTLNFYDNKVQSGADSTPGFKKKNSQQVDLRSPEYYPVDTGDKPNNVESVILLKEMEAMRQSGTSSFSCLGSLYTKDEFQKVSAGPVLDKKLQGLYLKGQNVLKREINACKKIHPNHRVIYKLP